MLRREGQQCVCEIFSSQGRDRTVDLPIFRRTQQKTGKIRDKSLRCQNAQAVITSHHTVGFVVKETKIEGVLGMKMPKAGTCLALSLALLLSPAPIAFAVDYGPDTQSVAPAPTMNSLSGQMVVIRKLIQAKNYKLARSNLVMADKEFPNDADVNNLLGFTSRKLKLYRAAGSYYAKALSINPEHLGALEYQGELFILMKKTSLAKKNLAKLKKLCGTNCAEYLELRKALG